LVNRLTDENNTGIADFLIGNAFFLVLFFAISVQTAIFATVFTLIQMNKFRGRL